MSLDDVVDPTSNPDWRAAFNSAASAASASRAAAAASSAVEATTDGSPPIASSSRRCARMTETLAWNPIGGYRGKGPLPAHMLFMDEDGTPGSHLR